MISDQSEGGKFNILIVLLDVLNILRDFLNISCRDPNKSKEKFIFLFKFVKGSVQCLFFLEEKLVNFYK